MKNGRPRASVFVLDSLCQQPHDVGEDQKQQDTGGKYFFLSVFHGMPGVKVSVVPSARMQVKLVTLSTSTKRLKIFIS